MIQRLLVMSSAERQVLCAEKQPAFKVFDGPAFRVVRKYVAELKEAYDAMGTVYRGREGSSLAAPYLNVMIVSAKYGPIPWATLIECHDEKLTPAQAEARRDEWVQKLKHHCQLWRPERAFVYGGQTYKQAVPVTRWQPVGCAVELGAGGLAHQLGQLKRWLLTSHEVAAASPAEREAPTHLRPV
jgi:hypothetical protein